MVKTQSVKRGEGKVCGMIVPRGEEEALDSTPNPVSFSPPAVEESPKCGACRRGMGFLEISSAKLKTLAKKRNIKGYGSMKKAQLIAALRAA